MKNFASECVVIGDIVGSRRQVSREIAQNELLAALAAANAGVQMVEPFEPTVGDEFQGVCASVEEAARATLLVRLTLPEQMDVRFGLGTGERTTVGESRYGFIQDGSAWWSARAAVDEVSDLARKLPSLRTRWNSPTGEDTATMNAYLTCRDEIVSSFDGRKRRLAAGLLAGRSQRELAEAEHISASAVSQAVRRGGVGIVVAAAQEI